MRITESRINELVSSLSHVTGVEYHASYMPQYGGWDLYVLREHGGQTHHIFGFDYRKSSREMYNYLTGVLAGISYSSNKQ